MIYTQPNYMNTIMYTFKILINNIDINSVN